MWGVIIAIAAWLLGSSAAGYVSALVALLAVAKAQFPGRQVRTMLVIENPATPLTVEQAQQLLASTGAIVVPGFTVTP